MRGTKAQKEAIRRPGGTIGQLEALAGLPSDEGSRFTSGRRGIQKCAIALASITPMAT